MAVRRSGVGPALVSGAPLGAGDSASVPPATVHTFRVGGRPARVRNVHRPVLDTEPYSIRRCGAANQRNLGDLTGPRALLYVAVPVREFPLRCRREP